MAMTIQIPAGVDAMEFLASFSSAFAESEEMQASLLGSLDSLRQAALLVGEPLGMLACLTAEEEAAAFLFYGLEAKGYSVPQYGKIQRHGDKLKLVLFAVAMHQYFFSRFPAELGSAIHIDRDGHKPKTRHVFNYSGYSIVQDDFLETIVTSGDEAGGHDSAINASVETVISDIIPTGFTTASYIKNLANRRNLCLYGDPNNKLKLNSAKDIVHYRSNCISMIVLGFLVFNSEAPTTSMKKLVDTMFEKMKK